MPILRIASMAVLSLFMISCATGQAGFVEIAVPPQRLVQHGYSILPLNERGWVVVARDLQRLALAKRGDNADETFAIQARTSGLPSSLSADELIPFLKTEQQRTPTRPDSTSKDTTSRRTRSKARTARSRLIAEDNAAVKRTTRSGSMILEIAMLSCVHPRDRSLAVHVIYSHRYYRSDRDSAFGAKAARVLDGLEFTGL